jgi:feruloyl esterase
VPGAITPGGPPFGGLPDLSGAFTTTERALLSRKVLERCDALDGVADGLVQEVEACQRRFDINDDVPTCAGARDGTCLTLAQKEAVGNIFRGARTSGGRPIYSSFPYDSGHATANVAFWEFTVPLVLDSGSVGFVFTTPPQSPTAFNGPAYSLSSNIDDLYRSIFATNATYRESGMSFMTPEDPSRIDDRLRRSSARMLVYHGVSDAIFSINDTTRWYRSLRQSGGHGHDRHDDGDNRGDGDDRGGHDGRGHGRGGDVVRLFHIPGMGHCSGGPATDQFDMLSALVEWVERGKAPERIVATARGAGNAGGVNTDLPASWAPDRTRPLCAYPKVASYQGGDAERAESFACR